MKLSIIAIPWFDFRSTSASFRFSSIPFEALVIGNLTSLRCSRHENDEFTQNAEKF